MGRYSFLRFIEVYSLILREIGTDPGQDLFKRLVRGLGEGKRVSVPRCTDRGQNTGSFPDILDLFCRLLGNSTGNAMFRRIIVELGPGEYLTVPYINCEAQRHRGTQAHRRKCNCCSRMCFARLERNEAIKNEFKGFNYREISLQFNISIRQVRRVVHGK